LKINFFYASSRNLYLDSKQ